MTERVLMAVHGMGVHEAGWEQEIRTKLEEVAGRYLAFKDDPAKLWDEIRLAPIGYDDILSQTLAEWRQNTQGVLDFVAQAALPGAPDLSWLGVLADEDPDFFWTHAGDVIIYRFFELQRAAIQTSVAKQLIESVPEVGGNRDFDSCTVMAHSLGTSVAHDTMHLLATQPIAGFPSAFEPRSARFGGIWMLANVGRLLQTEEAKVYQSVVRGGSRESASSNCGVFRSFAHKFDPFCVPKRFAPVGWSVRFNRVDSVDHLRDWNVHGWTHYLDNPRVHIPLLNFVLGRNAVKRSERIRAVDAYDRFGGRLSAIPEVQEALREAGSELARLHENADLRTTLEVGRRMLAIWGRLEGLVQGLHDELREDLEQGMQG